MPQTHCQLHLPTGSFFPRLSKGRLARERVIASRCQIRGDAPSPTRDAHSAARSLDWLLRLLLRLLSVGAAGHRSRRQRQLFHGYSGAAPEARATEDWLI